LATILPALAVMAAIPNQIASDAAYREVVQAAYQKNPKSGKSMRRRDLSSKRGKRRGKR
jgi:hypothetical protein